MLLVVISGLESYYDCEGKSERIITNNLEITSM